MATRTQSAQFPTMPPAPRARWSEAVAVCLLLALFTGLSFAGFRCESPVFDEVAHLPAGITYWQRHDLRLNPEHPPLFKLLAAWPVRHAVIDYASPYWQQCTPRARCGDAWRLGQQFFSTWNADAPQLLAQARLMMLLLALALGLVFYFYGRALGGRWGGLLSLGFFVASPFWIAYSPLVLNDVALALFCLLAVWSFAHLLNRPGLLRAAAFSLSLAAALLTKFSAGLLFAVFFLLWWWEVRSPPSLGVPSRPTRAAKSWIASGIAAAALLVDAVETVFGWNTPPERLASLAPGADWLQRLVPILHAHAMLRHGLLPPILYGEGIFAVIEHRQRPSYLLGHHMAHGSPLYFPLLFLFKMTPAFLLALVLLAGLALACHRFRLGLSVASTHLTHLRGLVLLGGIFVIAAIASQLNIGLRHCSPPIAALTLLTALIAPCSHRLVAGRHRRGLQWISGGLVAASLLSTVWIAPWFLTYFNLLIGNTPKYQVAGDSNLDWGQSLPDLQQFLQAHQARSVALDYFGVVPLHVYVPEAKPWSCEDRDDAPGGWVAVSASHLAAMANGHGCTWLFHYPSKPLAGGSIYVFFLPEGREPLSSPNPY